ncbi:MAG: NAD(P)H-hydrate dehydratase, partial [Halobacteriovoraceae bacterium]|nr:NAD(P)H-hydrate dehydratase [Halobacteriovoraceae bacterium]
EEMKHIENVTNNEFGVGERLIIENVAVKAARVIQKILYTKKIQNEMIFLIGKGSNGADGVATARHLSNKGIKCRIFLVFPEQDYSDELKFQLDVAKSYGVASNCIDDVYQLSSYFQQTNPSVVVDGIFGTGVQLPMSNFLYDIIEFVNDYAEYLFAIDIPSGIKGNSGSMQGNAIKADTTLAVGYPKLGHYIANGPKHSGELKILDVGFPAHIGLEGNKYLLRPEHMIDLVSRRDKFADKKVYGHSLVLGGSHGLTGAPVLTSQASLKAGSGLVTVATWEPQYQEMIQRLIPEVMTGYVPLDIKKWDRLLKDLNKYSSIVIGPGLARSSRARRLVLEVLNNFDGPIVIDADAINVLNLKEDKNVFKMRNAPTVLTPHFGEFARFMGISIEELSESPVSFLNLMVESINCTVVLKGPCTYLGCTDGSVYFNHSPNDGMATAGAGDVLAGILGGLLGQDVAIREKTPLVQRYEAFNRVVAVSIYLHSLAGKFAAKNYGTRTMTAHNLIQTLPQAFDVLDADIDRVILGQ